MPGRGLACMGWLFGGLALGVALGCVIPLSYGSIAGVAVIRFCRTQSWCKL